MLKRPRGLRTILCLALILFGSTLLVACFGDSEPEPLPQEEAPIPTAEATIEAEPSVTATAAEEQAAAENEESSAGGGAIPAPPSEGESALTIWTDPAQAAPLQQLADAFEAEFGLKITIVEKEAVQSPEDLAEAIGSGEGPDIFSGPYSWLGYLVENNLLLELALDNRTSEFVVDAVAAFRYNESIYGLPYAVETVALVYDPEKVTTPPATWSEVQQIAADLTSTGAAEHGLVLQSNNVAHFYPMLTAFGGYLFGRGENGEFDVENVGIDGSGALAAGLWLEGMVAEDYLFAVDDADAQYAEFANGDAAMLVADAAMLMRLRDNAVVYAVTQLPGEIEEAQSLVEVQGYMISAQSKDPELAYIFLTEFIAVPESMQALFNANGRPTAYLPVLDSTQDDELIAFMTATADSSILPAIPSLPAIWAAWAEALEQILQGESSETAFTNAAEQIRALIAAQ